MVQSAVRGMFTTHRLWRNASPPEIVVYKLGHTITLLWGSRMSLRVQVEKNYIYLSGCDYLKLFSLLFLLQRMIPQHRHFSMWNFSFEVQFQKSLEHNPWSQEGIGGWSSWVHPFVGLWHSTFVNRGLLVGKTGKLYPFHRFYVRIRCSGVKY